MGFFSRSAAATAASHPSNIANPQRTSSTSLESSSVRRGSLRDLQARAKARWVGEGNAEGKKHWERRGGSFEKKRAEVAERKAAAGEGKVEGEGVVMRT
jgi:hypothetical protein